MNLRSRLILFWLLLPAVICFSQTGNLSKYRLGIWSVGDPPSRDTEYQVMIEYMQNYDFLATEILSSGDIIHKSEKFNDCDLIWIYRNDTLEPKIRNSRKIFDNLSRFVEAGGKLILANQAAELVNELGLEDMVPETRIKKSIDGGYGRQLGYHAFRQHRLFEGMHGGAYVLKPLADTSLLQTGYFGVKKPARGKVIAVDWDYIFLRENSKLIFEYNHGNGKVLCIGAYLLFSLPNRNDLHLKTFVGNMFLYMLEPESGYKNYYWDYDSAIVMQKPFNPAGVISTARTGKFPDIEALPVIKPGNATGNYWDLAGERLLLMGDDHGGISEIWAHPALCLRDYNVSYRFRGSSDTLQRLSSLVPGIEVLPSSYRRMYTLDNGRDTSGLEELLSVSHTVPVGIVHYNYKTNAPLDLRISFRALFRLMWPYSEKVLGNFYYSWDDDLQAFIASDESGEFVTIVGIGTLQNGIMCIPSFASSERTMEEFKMPSRILSLNISVPGPSTFDIIIASSDEGLDQTVKYYLDAQSDPAKLFLSAKAHTDSLLDNSLIITGPDSIFNNGYLWALLATDRFQVATPGIGTSLTAGYATSDKGWDGGQAVSGRPGYGWYFGRDGAWSAFALLHYGDFEKVRQVLETFQDFQDLNGKIFHELTTSGVAHYDAADATPLYIILAGRYLEHSGDTAFIRTSWPCVKKAIDFCYSTDTDGDLLIENTNVGHGWVEGGQLFGSHTSLYLAACWAEALDKAAYIADNLGLKDEATKYRQDAKSVKEKINSGFWDPMKNYYFQGLMADGSYMDKMSIMPVIPMLFGLADKDKEQKVLPWIASDEFTSDWGCRIVPESDPQFNPRGYHTGSVWPLFTGWAALAEFEARNYLQAYTHLYGNLTIWQYWGLGFNEEVLNGEKYLPSGVCHHQCWSETMALEPTIEGMLGYKPDALKHRITLSPWFPADWDSVSVTGIRAGEENVSLEKVQSSKFKVQSEEFVTIYLLKKKGDERMDLHFQPVLPAGSIIDRIRVNGLPAREWATREQEQGYVVAEFGFWLDSTAKVEVHWHNGITALPLLSHPQPGNGSEGYRIISTAYNDDQYTITLQATGPSNHELRIWAADPSDWTADNAEVEKIEGNIITLKVYFTKQDGNYSEERVILISKSPKN